jgi:hypothetical protein
MSLMIPGHIVTAALNTASEASAIKYLKCREGLTFFHVCNMYVNSL